MGQAVTIKVFGRADFLHVYTPFISKDFPDAKPKFRAKIIVDPSTPKGKESMTKWEAAAKEVALAAWKKWPLTWADPKRYALSDGNLNLREIKDPKTGELTDVIRDGYKGMKVISASSHNAPWVRDADGKTVLTPQDNRPYAGCYCNFFINVKTEEKGGKGLFAYLEGVQFVKHGDPMGASRLNPDDVLQDESEELEDDDLV